MILDAADFDSRENCSFIRLNDAFRKTLFKAAKKTPRQPTMRTEVQSNTRAVSCIVTQFARESFGICRVRGSCMREYSLRSSRLEVMGARKNGCVKRRHARGEGALSLLACLPLACSFSLAPTTCKRLLRRLERIRLNLINQRLLKIEPSLHVKMLDSAPFMVRP